MTENIENMTLEVFQRKLWTWLEEKGIFSQMKTQLRRHMIDVLKSSEIGDAVASEQISKRSLSPKYKAINLLIAEYFLKQGYQYALSIFSVEDPTLSVLPEHMSKHHFESANGSENFKFAHDDVWDIFETLGCSKNAEENKEIYKIYTDKSSDKSLIVCLLRHFSELVNKFDVMKKRDEDRKTFFCSVESQTTEINKNYIPESKSSTELNNEIYQNMQIAFDNELRIIKENERKKHLNDLKMIESKFILKLKNEKSKYKEREIIYKKKITKEFEDEFQRIREKERLQEIKNERNLQKELETERQKLFEEYKLIIYELLAQKKNIDSSTLTELQQASLEAAMKAVQHQSNRLRKKEDTLDKALSIINEKTKKNKIDFSCQYSDKNYHNEVSQTVSRMISTNTIACQTNFDTSTKKSEFVQTTINNSSIHCQTDAVLNRNNKSSVSEKSIQTSDIFDFQNSLALQQKRNSELLKAQTIESMQNLIKNLQNENVQLKYEIRQQQVHIDELLNKHSSMHKEVAEARLDAQELSNQVIELEKTIDLSFKTPKEKHVSPKRDFLSLDSKIEKLKSKRTDIKFTDEGVQKIKETLKMLEREGEELEKSFREFKLRQLNKTKTTFSTMRNNTFSQDYNNHIPTPDSSSPSVLKQFREIRTPKPEVLPQYNNDYICNYSMDEYPENRGHATGRAFQYLMNFDKDILQNYITMSKDVKMYNPKNPKAFADMLKERHLNKISSHCDLNDLKAMTSIRMPKSIFPNRVSPKLRYSKFSDSINFVEKKYRLKNLVKNGVQVVSNSLNSNEPLIQKQNFVNSKKECTKNHDLDLKTVSSLKFSDRRKNENKSLSPGTANKSQSFIKANSINTVKDIETKNSRVNFLNNKTDISATSKINSYKNEIIKRNISRPNKDIESLVEGNDKKDNENKFSVSEAEKYKDISSYEKTGISETKILVTELKHMPFNSTEKKLNKSTSVEQHYEIEENHEIVNCNDIEMIFEEIKILDNQKIEIEKNSKQNDESHDEFSTKVPKNESIFKNIQEVANKVIDDKNNSTVNDIIDDTLKKNGMIIENNLDENFIQSIVENQENSEIDNTKKREEKKLEINNILTLEDEVGDENKTNHEINLVKNNEINPKNSTVDNLSDIDQSNSETNKILEIDTVNRNSDDSDESSLKTIAKNEIKIQENLKNDVASDIYQNDSEKNKVLELHNKDDTENIINDHETNTICNKVNYQKDLEIDIIDIEVKKSEIMDDNTKNNADNTIDIVDKTDFETSPVENISQDKEINSKIPFGEVENQIQKDKSDELIIFSSLDDSNHSQISIPQDSDASDSFWK